MSRLKLKPGHPSDALYLEEGCEANPSKWHLGNSRKRQELIKQFAHTSTVHGTAYVCSSGRNTSTCVKIIYRTLFGICFLLVVNNVTFLLQENLSKQSTFINTINRDTETGIEEDPGYFPLFPRITICRRPFYRIDFNESYLQLVQYVMLSLGYPFIPLTPQQVVLVVELAQEAIQSKTNLTEDAANFREQLMRLEGQYQSLKRNERFDLKDFVINHSVKCSDVFFSCIAIAFSLDCCTLFRPVFTSHGLCFTTHDLHQILDISNTFSNSFSLVLDLVTPPTLADYSDWGFRVFFTDPKEDFPIVISSQGQDVAPALHTTVRAHLIKKQRVALHTPWHGLWDTCPRWQYNATYDSDRYSHVACDVTNIENALRDKCDCQSLYHSSSPQTLKICEPLDMYDCFIRAVLANNLTDLPNACQQPCIVYSFTTESSYSGVGGDNNISRVQIIYDSNQYTYNEYRKTTLSSLFSQIGGSLGLYLGASIITVIEILTFTATWMWYRFVPAKDTAAVHPHHPPITNRRRKRH